MGLALCLGCSVGCTRDKVGSQQGVHSAPSRAVYHPAPEPPKAAQTAATIAPETSATAPVVELDASGIRFVVEAALRRGELPGCV
ncbi:MAG TPA: hypothetical protein VFZ61_15490, partial [Polyangiales bacterium]